MVCSANYERMTEKTYEFSKVSVAMNLDKKRLAGTLLSIGALHE
jgi:hypothetical protein